MAGSDAGRSDRTVRLRGIGSSGQARISSAGVIVIGAGGLGSPVLQYLAASGVGRIGIVDPDAVSASNLARQVIHDERGTGEAKVESARRAIERQNAAVDVRTFPVALTAANALDVLSGWDVVVDATDHPASRYLVSDAAALSGIPEVWGAALGFEGQVSVFGDGPGGPVDYRDLHPLPTDDLDSCSTVGVLGPVCGVIGSAMAVEVLKLITGAGNVLRGRVLHFDGAAGTWHGIALRRRPDRAPVTSIAAVAPEIEWVERGDRAVVDVREPPEHSAGSIPGSALIPLAELLAAPSLAGPGPVLLYCATGRRSATAAAALHALGVDAVSLRGGFDALPSGG